MWGRLRYQCEAAAPPHQLWVNSSISRPKSSIRRLLPSSVLLQDDLRALGWMETRREFQLRAPRGLTVGAVGLRLDI